MNGLLSSYLDIVYAALDEWALDNLDTRLAKTSPKNASKPPRQLLARIPDALHRDVRRLALEEETTMAALVEEALVALLEARSREQKSDGGQA